MFIEGALTRICSRTCRTIRIVPSMTPSKNNFIIRCSPKVRVMISLDVTCDRNKCRVLTIFIFHKIFHFHTLRIRDPRTTKISQKLKSDFHGTGHIFTSPESVSIFWNKKSHTQKSCTIKKNWCNSISRVLSFPRKFHFGNLAWLTPLNVERTIFWGQVWQRQSPTYQFFHQNL